VSKERLIEYFGDEDAAQVVAVFDDFEANLDVRRAKHPNRMPSRVARKHVPDSALGKRSTATDPSPSIWPALAVWKGAAGRRADRGSAVWVVSPSGCGLIDRETHGGPRVLFAGRAASVAEW
jgi:hypothetical protein